MTAALWGQPPIPGQGKSVLGIESQRAAVAPFAEAEGICGKSRQGENVKGGLASGDEVVGDDPAVTSPPQCLGAHDRASPRRPGKRDAYAPPGESYSDVILRLVDQEAQGA